MARGEISNIEEFKERVTKGTRVQKAKSVARQAGKGIRAFGTGLGKVAGATRGILSHSRQNNNVGSSNFVGKQFMRNMLPAERQTHNLQMKLLHNQTKNQLLDLKKQEAYLRKQRSKEQSARLMNFLGVGKSSTPRQPVARKGITSLFAPIPPEKRLFKRNNNREKKTNDFSWIFGKKKNNNCNCRCNN